MLIKGNELNQQSRQEVGDTHTVLDSDMIARGKVERLEGEEVDLIYVRRPCRSNVAARCCKGMGPWIPDRSGFIMFERPSLKMLR
jgi:pyridoxine/pyridoxamine 5'-phosphate oxidase